MRAHCEPERWYSTTAPDWMKRALRPIWPEQQARTLAQLSRDLDAALRMPGYQMAIAPPIRTRIDMLTTGVRTPVGIKVFGEDLNEIERLSVALEGMLRQVPGTRSTFAERQTVLAQSPMKSTLATRYESAVWLADIATSGGPRPSSGTSPACDD